MIKSYILRLLGKPTRLMLFILFSNLCENFLGRNKRRCTSSQRCRSSGVEIMLWPCCCMKAWRLDAQFLTRCSLGVWQYVLIRTLFATLAICLEPYHLYGEGHYDWDKLYIYYIIIVNVSQCWALYCLVLFYHELREELGPIKPLPKFLIVKAVVFFSWWQQIIITWMASQHMVIPIFDYGPEDAAKGLQNLLICMEMFIYGLCYHCIFTYKDFRAGGTLDRYLEESHATRLNPSTALKQMLPSDVIYEGTQYAVKARRLVKKKVNNISRRSFEEDHEEEHTEHSEADPDVVEVSLSDCCPGTLVLSSFSCHYIPQTSAPNNSQPLSWLSSSVSRPRIPEHGHFPVPKSLSQ
mmetsp:Transcript_18322/g.28547  ORF Transcript_18322/g.28547 Transcript_18322/m.28547 type:complete len:352 (+) Transcript_18322:670-1725(+)